MASTALDLDKSVLLPSPPQVELSQSLQGGSGMESVSQVSLSQSSVSSSKTSVPVGRLEIKSGTAAAATLPKKIEVEMTLLFTLVRTASETPGLVL